MPWASSWSDLGRGFPCRSVVSALGSQSVPMACAAMGTPPRHGRSAWQGCGLAGGAPALALSQPELAPWLALLFLASVPLPMGVGRGQGSGHALLSPLEGPCHPWASARPPSQGRAVQRVAAQRRPSSLPGQIPLPPRGLLLTSRLRSEVPAWRWGRLLCSLPELGSPSDALGALLPQPPLSGGLSCPRPVSPNTTASSV